MARNAEAPPPALKHGLTSRRVAEAMRDEVERLASTLVGSAPPDADVLEKARDAADAILRLRQVRAMKLHALGQAEPARQASRARARAGGKADKPWPLALLALLEREESLLRRLDDYERRASSRRARAIRELDLARIEAERRRGGAPDACELGG